MWWRNILPVLPIFPVSIFAIGLGLWMSFIGMSNPRAEMGMLPSILALLAVGLLGSATIRVIGSLGRRIKELEDRLHIRETATADSVAFKK